MPKIHSLESNDCIPNILGKIFSEEARLSDYIEFADSTRCTVFSWLSNTDEGAKILLRLSRIRYGFGIDLLFSDPELVHNLSAQVVENALNYRHIDPWDFTHSDDSYIEPKVKWYLLFNPELIRNIRSQTFNRIFHEKNYKGQSFASMMIRRLIVIDKLHIVLHKLGYRRLLNDLNEETLNHVIEGGELKGQSIASWLCYEKNGLEVLLYYPKLAAKINSKSLNRVIEVGKYKGQSPLSILCSSKTGRKILLNNTELAVKNDLESLLHVMDHYKQTCQKAHSIMNLVIYNANWHRSLRKTSEELKKFINKALPLSRYFKSLSCLEQACRGRSKLKSWLIKEHHEIFKKTKSHKTGFEFVSDDILATINDKNSLFFSILDTSSGLFGVSMFTKTQDLLERARLEKRIRDKKNRVYTASLCDDDKELNASVVLPKPLCESTGNKTNFEKKSPFFKGTSAAEEAPATEVTSAGEEASISDGESSASPKEAATSSESSVAQSWNIGRLTNKANACDCPASSSNNSTAVPQSRQVETNKHSRLVELSDISTERRKQELINSLPIAPTGDIKNDQDGLELTTLVNPSSCFG